MSASTSTGPVSRREFARLAGCDEKQVRRALESGKLTADADGKLDPAQLTTAWRRARRDSKDPPPAAAGAPQPPAADSASIVVRAHSVPPADAPEVGPAGATKLKEAVTRKEEFAGRLRELEFLERAGKLIELEQARKVFFEEARAWRDAWLNFPMRVSARVAADLGVEADRVREVLESHVHKQLAQLGTPRGDFAQAGGAAG